MLRKVREAQLQINTYSPLALKLQSFVDLSSIELAVLNRLHERRKVFQVGRDFVEQGQLASAAYILASGWVCSYKILPNGLRQIVDFQVPGDFLGLRSVLLWASDHCIEPITICEASEVSKSELLSVFTQTPRLATAVLWGASRDEAMVVEHLIDIGRRDAVERVGHFLLELGSRLTLVGLGNTTSYACPLTQYHLADALGLSAVHVNRVLRELREQGLLTFRNSEVTFENRDRLMNLVEYDPTYLDGKQPLLT